MKQKMDREVRIKVPEQLYSKFRDKCEKDLKTVSIVIRQLMLEYTKDKGEENR